MERGETLVNPFKKGSEIMRATSPGPEYEGPPRPNPAGLPCGARPEGGLYEENAP